MAMTLLQREAHVAKNLWPLVEQLVDRAQAIVEWPREGGLNERHVMRDCWIDERGRTKITPTGEPWHWSRGYVNVALVRRGVEPVFYIKQED